MIECKCDFCNSSSRLNQITKNLNVDGRYLYNEIWRCDKCNVDSHFHNNDLKLKVYHVKIREQIYIWNCFVSNNHSVIISPNGSGIKSFDFIPDIDPSNVATKMKTYLNFL